jgi:hypothetical protein
MGRIIVDTTCPNHSTFLIEDHRNWQDFYPDAEEEIHNNLPKSKGQKVRMIIYVDAYHVHDLVTRRSITGILLILNDTPIRLVSKRQKTLETSTYGLELVESRITTEHIIEVTLMLMTLDVYLEGPKLILEDNLSLLESSVPSRVLKKSHYVIVYPC